MKRPDRDKFVKECLYQEETMTLVNDKSHRIDLKGVHGKTHGLWIAFVDGKTGENVAVDALGVASFDLHDASGRRLLDGPNGGITTEDLKILAWLGVRQPYHYGCEWDIPVPTWGLKMYYVPVAGHISVFAYGSWYDGKSGYELDGNQFLTIVPKLERSAQQYIVKIWAVIDVRDEYWVPGHKNCVMLDPYTKNILEKKVQKRALLTFEDENN